MAEDRVENKRASLGEGDVGLRKFLLIKVAIGHFSARISAMQSASCTTASRRRFPALLLGVFACPFLSVANPSGEHVTAGSATFQRIGNSLTIGTGVRAIINWQDFSIGAGELTKFVQPSASSVTLNRVVGNNPSAIFGSLQANGQVWVINQNGILVGKGARIDTAGFLASTLDTGDAQFLKNGDVNFAGSSQAGVTNAGAIQAVGGDVFLIARHVENSGSITAAKGTVGLAAGAEVLLKQAGSERVFVKPAGTGAGGTGIDNSGSITAVQAELKAHGNIYALAINNSGVIRANTAVNEGGRVLLKNGAGKTAKTARSPVSGGNGGRILLDGGAGGVVNNSGTLDASGKRGGSIAVLGDRVNITGGRIDASGDAGGGTVLIGGDTHGAGTVRNATETTIGADARIAADAITTGNGGKVVVWSDETTIFNGGISVRGGAQGGNGGFVETSGKGSLGFHGTVDLAAEHGLDGTLLLDPRDITIAASGANDAELIDSTVIFNDGTPAATTDFTISNTALAALTGNIVLQAQRDITLASGAPLNLTNQTDGERFVMQAGRHITLNSAITTAGADIYLEADSPHSGTANDGVGMLTIAAPISTNTGGYIQLIGANFSITSTVNSGYRRSTRIGLSTTGVPLTIGSTISNASLDNLISTYQVWIGKATSAGSDGLGTGSVENVADSIVIGSNTILHNHGALLFFTGGDVNINHSLTTLIKTQFQATSVGAASFNVADGATFTNVSGGVQIDNYDIAIDTTSGGGGQITVPGQLNIGASDTNFLGLALGVAGISDQIAIHKDELARINTARLQLYTSNAASITVDDIDAASSATVGQLILTAGVLHQSGGVEFANHPATFKSLSVSANGGVRIDAGAPVTVTTGAISINADRFGENTGTFSNYDALTASAGQAITIEAADVNFLAAIVTTGALNLRPSTITRSIGIGSGSGSFSLTQSDITTAGGGYASVSIGRTDGKNAVAVSGATFDSGVSVLSPALGGIVAVTGALTAPGGVSLNAATVRLGSTVTTTANPITVKGTAITLTGDTALDTGAGAAISLTGILNGAYNLTLSAGTGAITLAAGTTLGTTTALTGFTATGATISLTSVRTVGAQSYNGNATLNGKLVSTSNGAGAIDFTGNLALAGNSTVTTANSDIIVDGVITGARTLSLTAGTGAVAVNNTAALPDAIGTGAARLIGFTASGATLVIDGNIWTSGVLSLKATAGDIANGGNTWTTGGLTTLNAGTLHDITIGGASNIFGTLALTGRNVSIQENAATDLGTSSVTGALDVQSTGAITDTGNVTVLGASSFAGSAITLNSAVNRYTGTISLATAGAGSVTLYNTLATSLNGGTYGGDFTVRSSGAISQIGALDIAGAARFTALLTNAAVNLSNPANNFNSIYVAGAGNATVTENSDTILAGSSVKLALTVLSAGGITQTGDLLTGAASFTSAQSGAAITLNRPGNSFAGVVSLNTTGPGSAALANKVATKLGAIVVGGDLEVRGASSITQFSTAPAGALNVGGASDFESSALNAGIVLNNASNVLTGDITLVTLGVGAATVVNHAATQLGASSVGGAFSLTAAGAVSQSGALHVGGALALNATGAIALDNASNTLTSLGTITRGGALDIIDSAGGLIVAGSAKTGVLTNDVTILTKDGDLKLNSGVMIAGDNITLAITPSSPGVTVGNFINNAGSRALSLGTGRFLIYSTSPAGTLMGSLPFAFDLHGLTYDDALPSGYTDNGFIFSQP